MKTLTRKRIPIYFKTEHQQAQFDLKKINPLLRAIVLEMNYYAVRYFNKALIITDVLRDDPKSPHCYGNAVDVRCWNLKPAEQQILLAYINKNFPYRHPWKWWLKTCLLHDVGQGLHFHVQARR